MCCAVYKSIRGITAVFMLNLPVSRFAFQPESLVVVTGSRVTYGRVCFFQLTVPFYTFVFADKMQRTEDWHGMLEGAGE